MINHFTIPELASIQNSIHSFWQTERDTRFDTEIIIPKGIVEVIFNFSEHVSIQAQLGGKQYQLTRCFINGFNSTSIRLQLPAKQFFFGIRFHPVSIKYIFGFPAGEFTDLPVDLTLVDPSISLLWHQLIEQKNFSDRVSVFSDWVNARNFHTTLQDQTFNNFLNNNGQAIPSVTELSNILCYSPRHLSRKLYALTGMNTEEVLVYKKCLQAVNLIHHTNFSLTQIAYSCQFADQSHFIRSFKSLMAMTPNEYRKIKSPLPGHIYLNVR